MIQEKVYEYIEEANKAQVMELLDAEVNRFRELYADPELIVMTLPVDDQQAREAQMEKIFSMIRA